MKKELYSFYNQQILERRERAEKEKKMNLKQAEESAFLVKELHKLEQERDNGLRIRKRMTVVKDVIEGIHERILAKDREELIEKAIDERDEEYNSVKFRIRCEQER
jgi:hypothetical protein